MPRYIKCHKCNNNGKTSSACDCGDAANGKKEKASFNMYDSDGVPYEPVNTLEFYNREIHRIYS